MVDVKYWFTSQPRINDQFEYEFIYKYFTCIDEANRDVDFGAKTAVSTGSRVSRSLHIQESRIIAVRAVRNHVERCIMKH